LEGLGMENVGKFYGHLECDKATWYICGHFVDSPLPPFWQIVP
jgi:hypothetical protein